MSKKELQRAVETLETVLRDFRATIEKFDKSNQMSLEDFAPEVPAMMQSLITHILYIDQFFSTRQELNYGLVYDFISQNKGINPQIRSLVPWPAGFGVQINLAPALHPQRRAEIQEMLDAGDFGDQISVAAYLDSDDSEATGRVLERIDELVKVLGYGDPEDVEIQRGSIFRRSWARIKAGVTADEVKVRAAKAERALELQGLVLPQAEADFKISQSINALMQSLVDVPNACVRAGSILLIKYSTSEGAVVLTRVLSPMELRALERFPGIQREPSRVIEQLALAVDNWQDGSELSAAD